MSLLELAFDGDGAHVGALSGLAVGLVLALVAGRVRTGAAVVTVTAWLYVLAYLGYVRERFVALRRERSWSRGERFVAVCTLVYEDARVGAAPIPVVLVGLAGAFATLGLAFAALDPLAWPTWAVLALIVPVAPLLAPLALGSAARRVRRDGSVRVEV